ncbi:2',3'-cyclic-nucleotide 3'-phosphodiesterase-like [Schistocerca gregaria]|uniref:2',3'-cyclic-nucleotide 3'-phosphodiesterase-like n=1 Tax=Schistocerca gregaria TaxID=7010 RepID=UPI00211F1174|nr:2',3'-cyclic-nucleotide 3'-phosphodiesterase-like [Schistocerca gregaria]XP_049856777.1 2',3'-cyclic-nucleotide 3'-phosphodiesterase-like [Schistocerca gregaria]XP_049856778.1 2',3'-cyclic-nucleotide 3'-phosphodiesterase-like [Schistocerca gregaria]
MGQIFGKAQDEVQVKNKTTETATEQCHPATVEPEKKVTTSKQYLNFTFLIDPSTVDYTRTSKTIFILRGLAGSGKSTIAKEIEETYKGAVICSADQFFTVRGRYMFNPKKLREAHEYCQEKARRACIRNENVIVIDNTNVQKWPMEYYFLLAFKTCYTVVLVEPQTPWKDDPLFLSIKNQHNVREETIQKKLEQWETVLPLYFGWFLNESDSRMLLLVGQAYLEECLKLPEFEEDFQSFSSLEDKSEMLEYYTKRGKLLHCTAKFCKCGEVPDALEYSSKRDVLEAYGKCYDLNVVGFVITPRTFGARVKLNSEEMKLWGGELSSATSSPQNSPRMKQKRNADLYIDVRDRESKHVPNCQASLICLPETDISLQPTKGFGSKAHITLGCADGIQPVTTGLDLLDVVDCEALSHEGGESVKTFTFSRGILRNYGQSRWVLYPNQKILVKSVFTGNY